MILEVLGFILIFIILFVISMVFENIALILIKVNPDIRKSSVFGGVMVLGFIINYFLNDGLFAIIVFLTGFYVFHKTNNLPFKETSVAYLLWIVMWLVLAGILSFITLKIV